MDHILCHERLDMGNLNAINSQFNMIDQSNFLASFSA